MLQFKFDDLQHTLISLLRDFKKKYDVELLYPLDEFQTNWILQGVFFLAPLKGLVPPRDHEVILDGNHLPGKKVRFFLW